MDYNSALATLKQVASQLGKADFDQETKVKYESALDFFKDSTLYDIRLMGDLLTQGLLIADEKGNILYVNKENEKMFRIPWEKAVGRNISEFTTGTENHIKNAASLQSKLTKDSYNAITIVSESGAKILQYSTPIRNEKDEIIGFLIIDQDISRFLENLNSLEHSESKIFTAAELRQRTAEAINAYSNLSKNHLPAPSESKKYNGALKLAFQAATSDVTVLLQGETGSGKEIFANYIHRNSSRSDKPFIKINCSAIPPNLFESELFGYAKGAYTGADPKGKMGYFELANTGTLLLDEVGELPLDVQAKLLRVIQDRQITRVGSTTPIQIDVRLIAATNRDLSVMVEEETFRQDLFYRLNIFPIRIPPLRERPEDIPTLTNYFLQQFNTRYDKHIALEPLIYHKMKNYGWPGNVRELENVIERWVVIFSAYTVISWQQVCQTFDDNLNNQEYIDQDSAKNKTMAEYMDEYQREILIWAKNQYGTTREMAKVLGVDHSTIVKQAKRLGISLS
jgi:PAS domain S-box-containing protein